MPHNKVSCCPGFCWSVLWILLWLLAWPAAFLLAVLEVFLIPFCVCFENAKTACEYIDRIYKIFAFDPVDNARYMRPLFYRNRIPVPVVELEGAECV
ncbi:hypothetical protein P879_06985 [Paragonimus westermani]|uniref:Uncharacterized protein n=1 Tax=Paragonimus westermani TaxID=34504 RepID=A0A8T0D488_9TREM|nr:hypothetical protein P879_06985 [Paragonimus westermani]